ncbi:MAG: signal peptidase I [Acholeplasmataceae bacterium]
MKNLKLKKISNIIFYTLTSILFVFVMLELVFPSKTMSIIGFKGFVVVSPSMEPIIKVNDMVIVTEAKQEDLEPGDIITFYTYLPTNQIDGDGNTIYQKNAVTHYLGEMIVSGDDVILKTYAYGKEGDYDTWRDEEGNPTDITGEDLIGKVAFKIPWIGTVITFFMVVVRNPIFLGLIAFNVVLVIILIKYIKKTKESKDDVAGSH